MRSHYVEPGSWDSNDPDDPTALSQLSDEQLAQQYQRSESPAIWVEVETRFRSLRERFVKKLARAYGLSRSDLPDAQQVAALATREAMLRFVAPGRPAPGDLACSVTARIEWRLLDLRRERDRIALLCRLQLSAEILDDTPSALETLIATEELRRLDALLQQLTREDRTLPLGRALKRSRRALALELKRTEKYIRIREKLLHAWLRAELTGDDHG